MYDIIYIVQYHIISCIISYRIISYHVKFLTILKAKQLMLCYELYTYLCTHVNKNLQHPALLIPQHTHVYFDPYYRCMFQQILLSAAWRWRDNSAETCRSCVKDCTHKLWSVLHEFLICAPFLSRCLGGVYPANAKMTNPRLKPPLKDRSRHTSRQRPSTASVTLMTALRARQGIRPNKVSAS